MNIVPLPHACDAARFGGKAAELARALTSGLPVPGGFALDAATVEELAAATPADVEPLALALREAGGRVAVRSSAVGEDGLSASFAGQHATILHVVGVPALLAAVRRVWESAHQESVIAYRRKLGIDGAPRIGVAVQTLIDSEIAGVLFTRNPLSGRDERVIEASWGLGEAVVAGHVTPDRFRIARDGTVLERTAGEKDVMIRASESGGTVEVEVEPHKVEQLCLDDAKLAALHALAQRCEADEPSGVDLEWAFVGTRLYLLQRRPITKLG